MTAPPAYVDTGVLAKLYVLEPESQAAAAIIRRYPPPLPFSPLHRAELWNALHLRVFRREASLPDITEALARLEADVEAGLWTIPEIDVADLARDAASMSAAHSTRLGTRTLDVLHVALARRLGARDFITHDDRQAALADAVGIRVVRLVPR